MENPNNCETCKHKQHPDGGWCYMFRDEPTEVCMIHSGRNAPLLPCPFCGAAVTMGKNQEGAKIVYFQVECDECGAIAGSGYTTEPVAAKNWNRRANV